MTASATDGRWDAAYSNAAKDRPQAYGDTVTYLKAAKFLEGLDVEDWGCGLGWMRRFVPAGRYTGVDGSRTPHADKIAKLSEYESETDGLFMRHVIEHNHDWRAILRNALRSFRKRMVLVLFTPLVDKTKLLLDYEITPGVLIPEYSLGREELMSEIGPYLVREETVRTDTRYQVEHVFYLEKTRTTLVTAFFRLRDRAVDEDEAFRQFRQLAACGLPIILFLDRQLAERAPSDLPNVRVVLRDLGDLWSFQQGDERPLPAARTPDKDTRDFILLQNAKLDLLASARGLDESSHFAWVDFGIMKVVKDPAGFHDRLRALKPATPCVVAPGCWPQSEQVAVDGVCWRFCGGFLLVDRNSVASLVSQHHKTFSRLPALTWEVNVWAEMEREGARFDWYKADHDDSIVPSVRPRVCLVMIVKNEGAIIERCLSSALPYVDCWAITDTGSTDRTPEAIERFFAERGVPGKLSRAPFENFAQARNAALRAAEEVRGWDYALLIDADMVLSGELDRAKLTGDAYRLVQWNGTIDYWNTRLVRRSAGARYVGVTHEYLTVQGENLEGPWIDDRNDGGSKGDKGERDIKLLRAGLQAEPGNVRYMFYLANTLRETGQFKEAAEWYGRRVAAGGWDEEVWCSQYYLAKCHQALGDEASMLREALGAYERRPSRGEPLKLLARHYRERGQNERALVFARTLKGIEYPSSDLLFVERDAYEDGADEEISIAGYYSKRFREEGYRACAELTVSFNPHQRDQARKNATHYARSAADLFDAEVRQIPWKPGDGYAPMNPSVCVTPDGRRLVLVRTVNYTVTSQGQYPTVDGSGIIRTRNHVVEMGEGWTVNACTAVEDASGLAKNSFPVEGFEDCRLWQATDGSFRASATVRDLGDGRCEMAVLTLDERWRVTGVDVVRDQEHDKPQKNWMPIVGRPGQFLYWCDPTIVVERAGGKTRELARHEPNVCLVDQRGSSQVIPFRDGWLCLTHEVAWRPERVYLHRFLKLEEPMKGATVPSPSLRVTAVSDLFYFHQVGIEFCAGLAVDGGKLVASFGVNDASAWLAFIDPDRIELWPTG